MIEIDEAAPPQEPDCLEGAPHPRETERLFGHDSSEASFLQAFNSGRLHHGWLISGPRGVGKATLAWRIARFLLAAPEADEGPGLFGAAPATQSLDVAIDHPVARRLLARSEPRLYHVTRSLNEKTKRLSDQIVAKDVRDLSGFFGLKAADGGRRVVLIDAVDDMNPYAANALLKMLEEPPAQTTLLLVSHQPGRLLPTIRSRCRSLTLGALEPDDLSAALLQAGFDAGNEAAALSELSLGSVGAAIGLLSLEGAKLYAEVVALAESLPGLDRARAVRLANSSAARGGEARLDLLFDLIELFLTRLAKAGARGIAPPEAVPGEAEVIERLAGSEKRARDWAACAQEIGDRTRHGRAVNLDPATLVLDTVFQLQRTAQAV